MSDSYDDDCDKPHIQSTLRRWDSMTTDTPRTDALETQCERENMTRDAPWELARTLERELAGCRHAVNTYISRIAELKSELAEAEKFRDYFERESVIWRKRAEKAERERDEALISALGMEYDENGWQDLARAALDMYGRKP